MRGFSICWLIGEGERAQPKRLPFALSGAKQGVAPGEVWGEGGWGHTHRAAHGNALVLLFAKKIRDVDNNNHQVPDVSR